MTPDWVSAFGNLLTGIAAAVAAGFGAASLNAWRREVVGRRKLEVAEKTLASFYRIREVIQDSRVPLIRPAELQPQEGEDPEIAKRTEYAAWRRLAKQWDLVLEWRANRHVFTAFFGIQRPDPFGEIEGVLNSISASVDALLNSREDGAEDREFLREMRRTVFRTAKPEDDKVTSRLDAAVKQIEKVCFPVTGVK